MLMWGDGTFHNVLCVPSLSTNLLLVYQITHIGLGKRVEFTPNLVEIRELCSDSTLTLESLGIHDRSSDESNSPKQSSTSTSNVKSDLEDSPPSSPSHHSQVDDSPLDSPSFGPLWARQTLQFGSDWVGDPSDTRQAHLQFQDAPHVFIATTLDLSLFMKLLVFLSGIQLYRKSIGL